ncbi:MAG: TetR/AcrR family transcriptional regulator [Candidatus Marinimicrobia bacterium]|nr:TetR/AcrR family transcriptional regulator [Candidatus Neomarinimicrobiota bacterium]
MNKLDTKTRQKQILDASLNLIKEGGIQNLTMKRISQKVGISEQAIYRHFRNKQDILCTIISHFNNHFEAVFESVKKIEVIEDRIQAFMDGHLNYFQANPATAAVIFSEEIFQYDSTLAQKVNELVERRIAVITKFVESAQAQGKFKPGLNPEDLAYIFLGSLRFLVTTWRLGGFKYNIRVRGESMKSTILQLIK